MARDQVMSRIVGEVQTSLRTQHREKIDQANLAGSFDATVGREFEPESANFINLVLSDMGMEESLSTSRLGARLSSILYDRFRDEWGQISAPPGERPYSLEQRKREMYRKVNDIKDRMIRDMTEKPDSLGLPPDLLNIIRQSSSEKGVATADAEISAARGKIATAADVSRYVVTSNAGSSAIRGSGGSSFGRNTFVSEPLFVSEESLFSTAKSASSAYQQVLLAQQSGTVTPEMVQKHNSAKMAMGIEAQRFLSDFTSTSIEGARARQIPWVPSGYYHGRYRSIPENRNAPLFILREEGVLVAMQSYYPTSSVYAGDIIENGILYAPAPELNNRYWAAKSLIGYSPEEVSKGITNEGVRIGREHMDAREFLFFQSFEQFSSAVDEYTASGGRTGYIAEQVLPKTGMSFDALRATQFNLLGIRKPTERAEPK